MANDSSFPPSALADQIARLARGVPVGAKALSNASANRWAGSLLARPEYAHLRSARATWRFFMGRRESTSVFFFFRRTGDLRVLLDAAVTMAVRSTEIMGIDPPEDLGPLPRRVQFPPFLLIAVTDEQLGRFGLPESTRDNTLFLRIGPNRQNVLAVLTNGRRSKLRYSPGGVPGPEEPRRGSFPVLPFLHLIEDLRSWMSGDFDMGIVAGATGPLPNTVIGNLLEQIGRGYAEATNTATNTLMERSESVGRPQLGPYALSEYKAELRLRLRRDGSIAERENEELYQLLLRVAVPDPARPALTIQVGPPDFLVSGPLYDAFFHALNVPGAVADLARALGVARGFIPPFLREAQENGAVIFRAQRVFDEDANVLLLRGRLAGQELTIVIETLFRVQAHRNPPVVEHVPGFIDVILGRGEDAATKRVDASSVEGILAFLGNLHVWTKVAG